MSGNNNQNKVSIITPTYNCEKYIRATIASVQAQTYTDWEMVLADDCSSDHTREIIEEIMKEDPRVHLYCQEKNSGAAASRNLALEHCTGRFIAYLDADDLWKPEKLEHQVSYMLAHGYGFCCTSYEVLNDAGESLDKQVHMLPRVDYKGFLTNNLLQTVGIMVDTSIVDRKCLVMPDMRRRQDAATWLQVLKAGHDCYGLDEILACYRRTESSLSSNKLKAVKGVWYLYRKVEHLSLPFSCYCFVRYAFLAVWKRIYRHR
ncbi:MAG: glycosyltransferase family 2 protein [Wujia sp.]